MGQVVLPNIISRDSLCKFLVTVAHWRSGTLMIYPDVPGVQMSCRNLTRKACSKYSSPNNGCLWHANHIAFILQSIQNGIVGSVWYVMSYLCPYLQKRHISKIIKYPLFLGRVNLYCKVYILYVVSLFMSHFYRIHYLCRVYHQNMRMHDDVIKLKYFPRYWSFVRGIHRSPVNSPHKGQSRGALMFTLICARINGLSKQWWGWWFKTPSRLLWRGFAPCRGLLWLGTILYHAYPSRRFHYHWSNLTIDPSGH